VKQAGTGFEAWNQKTPARGVNAHRLVTIYVQEDVNTIFLCKAVRKTFIIVYYSCCLFT